MKQPITLRERIERYIAACPPAISGQHGHDRTFRVACILVQGFDLSPEDALSFLARYNQRCEPPWTERELEHKLRDADRAEGYKSRGYLLQEETRLVESDLCQKTHNDSPHSSQPSPETPRTPLGESYVVFKHHRR